MSSSIIKLFRKLPRQGKRLVLKKNVNARQKMINSSLKQSNSESLNKSNEKNRKLSGSRSSSRKRESRKSDRPISKRNKSRKRFSRISKRKLEMSKSRDNKTKKN